tara:strand:- start:137 stop:346 length:210 start_codon:yes stop_codon:yes gene_type:complete
MPNYNPITGQVGDLGPKTVKTVKLVAGQDSLTGRVFSSVNRQAVRLTGNRLNVLIQKYKLNNIDVFNIF